MLKLPKMRFRYVYMVLFTLLAFSLMFLTDPDNGIIQNLAYGAGFVATIVLLTKVVVYVSMLHISRKARFDYVDLQKYFTKTVESPLSASIALIAAAIFTLCITLIIVRFG